MLYVFVYKVWFKSVCKYMFSFGLWRGLMAAMGLWRPPCTLHATLAWHVRTAFRIFRSEQCRTWFSDLFPSAGEKGCGWHLCSVFIYYHPTRLLIIRRLIWLCMIMYIPVMPLALLCDCCFNVASLQLVLVVWLSFLWIPVFLGMVVCMFPVLYRPF